MYFFLAFFSDFSLSSPTLDLFPTRIGIKGEKTLSEKERTWNEIKFEECFWKGPSSLEFFLIHNFFRLTYYYYVCMYIHY